MPLNENMPDLPDGFSYESLYRAKVEDEEKGFEKCRELVIKHIDEVIETLWDKEGDYTIDSFVAGQDAALQQLRDWVSGQRATSEH